MPLTSAEIEELKEMEQLRLDTMREKIIMVDGKPKLTIIWQPLGRCFIRGREVYRYKNRVLLGDNFFRPPGTYGGFILS